MRELLRIRRGRGRKERRKERRKGKEEGIMREREEGAVCWGRASFAMFRFSVVYI